MGAAAPNHKRGDQPKNVGSVGAAPRYNPVVVCEKCHMQKDVSGNCLCAMLLEPPK